MELVLEKLLDLADDDDHHVLSRQKRSSENGEQNGADWEPDLDDDIKDALLTPPDTNCDRTSVSKAESSPLVPKSNTTTNNNTLAVDSHSDSKSSSSRSRSASPRCNIVTYI